MLRAQVAHRAKVLLVSVQRYAAGVRRGSEARVARTPCAADAPTASARRSRAHSGRGPIRRTPVRAELKWTIHVVQVDPRTRTIVTNEHGGVIRRWNHTLHVDAVDAMRSRYTDSIEIEAGALTGVVAAAVRGIFSYRQSRLRRLARRHLGAVTT